MCSPEEVRQLQAALLCFTDSERNYGDLSKIEQRAVDLANALFITLERLKLCQEQGSCHVSGQADESELGGIFHGLAVLADSGALAKILTPENQTLIKSTLGNLKEVGMGGRAAQKGPGGLSAPFRRYRPARGQAATNRRGRGQKGPLRLWKSSMSWPAPPRASGWRCFSWCFSSACWSWPFARSGTAIAS